MQIQVLFTVLLKYNYNLCQANKHYFAIHTTTPTVYYNVYQHWVYIRTYWTITVCVVPYKRFQNLKVLLLLHTTKIYLLSHLGTTSSFATICKYYLQLQVWSHIVHLFMAQVFHQVWNQAIHLHKIQNRRECFSDFFFFKFYSGFFLGSSLFHTKFQPRSILQQYQCLGVCWFCQCATCYCSNIL